MLENLVLRDGFDSPVPRQTAHLHTKNEFGTYFRDSSRVPRRRPFLYLKLPYAIGSVPSLSGHAIGCRWRSLPRVHRHRASKPQISSERVLPWQVTLDQLICAALSHTHFCMKWSYRSTGIMLLQLFGLEKPYADESLEIWPSCPNVVFVKHPLNR